MARITPKDRESPFSIEELFFSRTDKRGVITAGNSVFARVSGYPLTEMLGKPHNLIRHPDMPKAVFRYFWETIQSHRTIVAYVKNMAIDGSYYWVLAAAFPTSDGYVSIRMKPTSAVLATVQQLYAELLSLERSAGIDKSYERLFERLREIGFHTYEDFARHALVSEMTARDAALSRTRGGDDAQASQVLESLGSLSSAALTLASWLQRVDAISADAAKKYARVFQLTEDVAAINTAMQKGAQEILSSYRAIRYLSFNMVATAERAGEKGRVLGVVSETFQKWAGGVCEVMEAVDSCVGTISKELNATALGVMTIRFQFDMLSFYAHELIAGLGSGASDHPEALETAAQSMLPFVETALEVFAKAEASLQTVRNTARDLDALLEQLHEGVSGLLIIRQTGRMEAAYLDELQVLFDGHIASMGDFINKVGQATTMLRTGTAKLTRDLGETGTIIASVAQTFRGIRLPALRRVA